MPWCSTVTALWQSQHREFITVIYNALPKTIVVNKMRKKWVGGGEEMKEVNTKENKGDGAAEWNIVSAFYINGGSCIIIIIIILRVAGNWMLN